MASSISLRLISYLFVIALSIQRTTANVGDDMTELNLTERTLYVADVSMLLYDGSLPGSFDTITINVKLGNGPVTTMNPIWPNAESYSPRLSIIQVSVKAFWYHFP